MNELEFKKFEKTLFMNCNSLVHEAKTTYETMLKNHIKNLDEYDNEFIASDKMYNIFYFLGSQNLVCILNKGKKNEYVALKYQVSVI